MNKVLLNEENSIYRTQFASLACISAFTFKLVMLPSYFAQSAGNLAFLAMAIMMLIDTTLYGVVFYIAKRVNVLKIENKALMIPIMAAIFIMSISRILVLTGETVAYTSSTLFDQGKITFILITLLPVLAYICLKGATAMGRMAQIVFAIAALAIGATLLLLRVDLDFGALLPLDTGYNNVLTACDKHYFWFGDYIPLLFAYVVPPKRGKEKNFVIPLTLLLIFTGIVGFYILFTIIYADAGKYIAYAFNKIAVFNKVTELIGPTNFPVIIAWILMSIVKLSILFYAAVMSLTYFIKSKKIAAAALAFAIGMIIGFVMPNLESSYGFAAGWMRYVVGALQYSVPIVLFIYVLANKKKLEKEAENKRINEPPEYVQDANESATVGITAPSESSGAVTADEKPENELSVVVRNKTTAATIEPNCNYYSPNAPKIGIKHRAARFTTAFSRRKGYGNGK